MEHTLPYKTNGFIFPIGQANYVGATVTLEPNCEAFQNIEEVNL